jgi:hypothetical protein
MATHAIPREVLPTSEARSALSSITAGFRKRGASSAIVIFGNHRRPEAAVIPYELVELLDPIIEDLVIAQRVRDRLAADDGTRFTLEEVAESVGVDLDEA